MIASSTSSRGGAGRSAPGWMSRAVVGAGLATLLGLGLALGSGGCSKREEQPASEAATAMSPTAADSASSESKKADEPSSAASTAPSAAPSTAGGEATAASDPNGLRGPSSTGRGGKGIEERPVESPAPRVAGAGAERKPLELGAVTLPVMKDCVRDCVQRNAMRAESAGPIETDCRQACLDGCQKRCDAEAPGRAPQFGGHCRQDCERQGSTARF
jgi:hypothetical protein